MEGALAITELAERAATGKASVDDVSAAIDSIEVGDPRRDELLNALAQAGANGAAPAVDVLVTLMYRERFVRAEIRKVLINDTSAAEEALQETALAVARGLPSFRGESTFRTWACSIGRNQAIGVLRRLRPADELTETSTSEVARFSSVLAQRADIEAALATLPEHFRQPVWLRDIEQQTYEEIATNLGIELNTVRSRLARGRARLAAAFDAEVA